MYTYIIHIKSVNVLIMNNVIVIVFVFIFPMLGFNCLCIFRQMKDKPKVPMPGSRLNDPTPGELRGDQKEVTARELESSALNLTPPSTYSP